MWYGDDLINNRYQKWSQSQAINLLIIHSVNTE